ncbi:MAG: VOC family protein [Caldilineaceae bacterium]|jgi:uncharacterized glyoxalase superfamily protein PhnB
MKLNGFYPLILTNDVAVSSQFYMDHFGFQPTFQSDWYVSLIHSEQSAHQLAFIALGHESIPAEFRGQPSNLLLSFEVADATAEYDRLQAAGMKILHPLRDEPWGQRHFIGVDPQGTMVDVIELIPPSPEFLAQYR